MDWVIVVPLLPDPLLWPETELEPSAFHIIDEGISVVNSILVVLPLQNGFGELSVTVSTGLGFNVTFLTTAGPVHPEAEAVIV